jgi:thymidylate synthase
MRKLTDFDVAYGSALRILLDEAPAKNARTGKSVKAAHGMLFQFGPKTIPLLTLRDIKPLWACAEAVWFMGGGESSDFMEKFGFKVWRQFSDSDGFVQSATGYRWRKAWRVDQVKELVKKLTRDPSNRQGVLTSWDPVSDNLTPGLNTPCVDMWHFHIIDGCLHMSVLQRSGDMYFGVPHDVFGSRIVQELLAAGLGMKPGAISYLVSNAHLYEDQWPAAEEMLGRAEQMAMECERAKMKMCPPDLRLTKDDFVRSMVCDETLPLELSAKVARMYDPWPAISGPKLVL